MGSPALIPTRDSNLSTPHALPDGTPLPTDPPDGTPDSAPRQCQPWFHPGALAAVIPALESDWVTLGPSLPMREGPGTPKGSHNSAFLWGPGKYAWTPALVRAWPWGGAHLRRDSDGWAEEES